METRLYGPNDRDQHANDMQYALTVNANMNKGVIPSLWSHHVVDDT